ncbi:Hypothetical predicted protein, partial [Paramuricea clavata]
MGKKCSSKEIRSLAMEGWVRVGISFCDVWFKATTVPPHFRLSLLNFQRHVSQAEQEEFSDNILRLRISYIYEINKDTKLTSSDVRKKVESAIEEVSGAMKAEQYMSNDHTILIYIESIRPFHNSGKPLAHYNAAELSRFLNNDAHFGKLSKRTDNTQIIALGDHFETEYPEEDIGWAFDSHDTLQLPDED